MESQLLSRLKDQDSGLYHKLAEVREAAAAKLARIVEVFPHYTCHDITHKDRVLGICGWLAGPELISRLNGPELFSLIASIYLHDVGMALAPDERTAIESSPEYQQFKAGSALTPVESLAEWVRRVHHKLSAEILRNSHSLPTGVPIRDRALAHATSLLCESHGLSDLEDFEKYDPFFAVGTSGTTICVPLLGVLLRLSDLLHLTEDRTPLAVLPLVRLDNSRSQMEWRKHLSTVGIAPILPTATVRMTCTCDHPNVHRDILRLCDYVNQEFSYSSKILAKLEAARPPRYRLACTQLSPNISAQGYEPWLDWKFELDREGIIALLTGERLYRGPGAVVKELLMNAVDACRQSIATGNLACKIRVMFNEVQRRLTVSDDGIGMSKGDLSDFLLRLGKCIYRSGAYQQRYQGSQCIESVSEFGIGFASCFLVSDRVEVETKRDGEPAYLLDLYDLLGFAAARKSKRTSNGTTVTLHLKESAVRDIENAVRAIGETCPHVEIPISVDVNGSMNSIEATTYCDQDCMLLVPFYRDRPSDVFVDHRHFEPATEHIDGCIRLLCQVKEGVVLPGYSDFFKLSRADRRRVSQLGFALPNPDKWPECLLGAFNVTSFMYDLDLRGDMRLEMDPSRTTVLPSPNNLRAIRRLDDHIAQYLCDLHERHWNNLPREARLNAHRLFGQTFFTRVMRLAWANDNLGARRIVDLMFDNMPFCCALRGASCQELTWNEIRSRGIQVLFYRRYRIDHDWEDNVRSILDANPDVLVIVEEPSFPFGLELLQICTVKKVHVSDFCRSGFQIAEPCQGDANTLMAQQRDSSRFNPWGFIVPFVPSAPYAFISSMATRRSGNPSCWVNASHPKVSRMFNSAIVVEQTGRKMPKCAEFLRFLNEFHFGKGTDPEFVEFVQRHQHVALSELLDAAALSADEVNANLFQKEDMVPWEGNW